MAFLFAVHLISLKMRNSVMNKQSIQIALAYMSVVIGGGFASGQEVLQFFTGYGLVGIVGTLVSGLMFAFLGMQIARMRVSAWLSMWCCPSSSMVSAW